MISRKTGIRALSFAATLTFSLLGSAAAQDDLTPVKFGYTGASAYMAAFIAKDQGLFEKHGLDVEMVYVTKGAVAVPSLLGGSLDVSIVTAPGIITQQEGELDLVALAATNVNVTDKSLLVFMSRPDVKIARPTDVEGLRIGIVSRHAISDVLFRKWARDRDVDIARINFVELGMAQMGDMMGSKQLDGALVVEPFVGRFAAAGQAETSIDFMTDFPNGMIMGAFMSTRTWAQDNREAALAFKDAIYEAVGLFNSDNSIAYPSIAKHLKLPVDLVQQMALPDISPQITQEQLQYWSEIAFEDGVTRTRVDTSGIIFE